MADDPAAGQKRPDKPLARLSKPVQLPLWQVVALPVGAVLFLFIVSTVVQVPPDVRPGTPGQSCWWDFRHPEAGLAP